MAAPTHTRPYSSWQHRANTSGKHLLFAPKKTPRSSFQMETRMHSYFIKPDGGATPMWRPGASPLHPSNPTSYRASVLPCTVQTSWARCLRAHPVGPHCLFFIPQPPRLVRTHHPGSLRASTPITLGSLCPSSRAPAPHELPTFQQSHLYKLYASLCSVLLTVISRNKHSLIKQVSFRSCPFCLDR